MDPISQGFLDLWKPSACATHLCRVVRRDCDDLATSFCRFAAQDSDECSPSDVIGRFCQACPGNASSVQVLVGNQAVARDQRTRRLEVKVASLVSDMSMLLLQQAYRLRASSASLLATCDLALCPSECSLGLAIVFWGLDFLTFIGHEEGFQAQVNAESRKLRRSDHLLTHIAREDDVPVTGFPFERDGFDLARHFPMPLHLEQANMLEIQPTVFQFAPITIGRKGKAIEAVLALEAVGIGTPAEQKPSIVTHSL